MAKEVKFNIKLNVDGKELVSEVTTDVKSMRKAWDNAAEGIKRCGEHMLSVLIGQCDGGIKTGERLAFFFREQCGTI